MRTLVLILAAVACVLANGALGQSGPSSAAPGTSSGTHDPQTGNPPRLDRDSLGMGAAAPGGPSGPSLGAEPPRNLVDPQPPATAESAASEARIRAMLEAQGYTDVQNIRKEGEGYTATALRD